MSATARKEAELLEAGKRKHEAGDLRGAADAFSQVLRGNPRHPVALYRMGCLLHEAGDLKQAAELLRGAVDANPAESECHNALAMVFFGLGQATDAEQCLRDAIALSSKPHFHLSLAGLLRRGGRFTEALAEYQTALDRGADPSGTRVSMGRLQVSAGEGEQGRAHFREILKSDPRHAGALWSLRESLRSENRDDEAAAYLDRAIVSSSSGLREFADALQTAGDFSGAVIVYRTVVAADAEASAETWFALGCAETSRNEFAGAVGCFERVLQIQPNWNKARHNLGRALFEIGRVDEAAECLRACAASNDESAELARGTLAVIIPGVTGADNQAVLEARRGPVAAPAIPRFVVAEVPLRIGYVSSFFQSDNWMKPVWGLINQHDRAKVEVHLFSDADRAVIGTGYREHPHDRYHDTRRLDVEALRQRISESGVQVLIDLNGYSDPKRLPIFQQKMAPVTIGWFNLYATTGLPGFDYLIGDEDVVPADEERFYSERILRVRGSYLTFDVDYPVPPVAERLVRDGVTFGSLCSLYKITPEVIASWSRIVMAVPGSRLLLRNAGLKSEGARAYLRGEFARCGLQAERLELEGPADHFSFLRTYDRIDLALDTFPYNGGTSTTEAIWQGVPVLTFAGDRWASRTSASILRAAELGEFVANDRAGFEALAVRWAGMPLDDLRAGLRERIRASAACDTAGFARQMESLYKECVSR